MKIRKKHAKRNPGKRRAVLTERELSTIHGGKKATKKATKTAFSEPIDPGFIITCGGGGQI